MKRLRIVIEGKTYEVDVEIIGEENAGASRAWPAVSVRSSSGDSAPTPPPSPSTPPPAAAMGDVLSPLAGTVVSIEVTQGQQVAEGDKLITLEAMKMNTIVSAPSAGVVSKILVQPGESVEEGKPLLSLS